MMKADYNDPIFVVIMEFSQQRIQCFLVSVLGHVMSFELFKTPQHLPRARSREIRTEDSELIL